MIVVGHFPRRSFSFNETQNYTAKPSGSETVKVLSICVYLWILEGRLRRRVIMRIWSGARGLPLVKLTASDISVEVMGCSLPLTSNTRLPIAR